MTTTVETIIKKYDVPVTQAEHARIRTLATHNRTTQPEILRQLITTALPILERKMIESLRSNEIISTTN